MMNSYFVLDSLNLLFLIVTVIVLFAVSIYQGKQSLKYNVIFVAFALSMIGAIMSNNLGLTWVFVEATTLTSAYLLLQHKNKNSLEATWKYIFLCSVGISLAFVGIILLLLAMGSVNSLNYQVLYNNVSAMNPFLLKLVFIFLVIGFGTKVGLAPVHSWLPDAHAEAPSPVSAMLSAALLNSAFLPILRMFKLMVLTNVEASAQTMLLIMGLLSLFVAAIFIFKTHNYKRMLAYSSIENMGIVAIGIALGGVATIGALIHLFFHSLIKCSLFLTSGNILKLYNTKEISFVKGILRRDKITGLLWVCGIIFIVAIPPSPLFISEFLMIKQMLIAKEYIVLFLFASLLTYIIFGMVTTVTETAYDKEENDTELKEKLSFNRYFPQVVLLLLAMVGSFCITSPIYEFLKEAAKCIY